MTSPWRIAGQLAGLRFLAPGWRPAGFVMLGVTAGMGLFVFHVSRAASYLSDAPETCMNCHVMTTQYVTWQHSSHARVATCNDCHVPHTSLAAQYGFKAKDGLWHATVFTMRWEPQVDPAVGRRGAGGGEQLPPLPRRGDRRRGRRPHTSRAICAAGTAIAKCRTARCRSLRPRPACSSRDLPRVPEPIQQPTIGGRTIVQTYE